MPRHAEIVDELLERHGSTYAEEAGIKLDRERPSALFQLLVLSILLSARISGKLAVAAARALFDEGWTTPEKLANAGWERRTRVLNRAGYARYDERTSRMLGDTCDLLGERWSGDLRRLRDEAAGDREEIRSRLKEFKGMGDVGADIFLREVQCLWEEARPFFDDRVVSTARDLGLPADERKLAGLIAAKDTARLAAAIVRAGLAGDEDEVREAAGAG